MTLHSLPLRPDTLATIAAGIGEFIALRHDLHRHPELSREEHRTAGIIAGLLGGWGYEVTAGVGGTGVVATLQAGSGTRSIGLRADMDALPIFEATGLPFSSVAKGVMHACGHDGHTAILLAAAKHLAETRAFDGRVTLIFQPAEEIGAGARAMIADGLFTRFPVDAVFGLHNWPGLPAGQWGILPGPVMAGIDQVFLTVQGRGGHGAAPQETVDPVVTAAHAIAALQSVVSRNIDPQDAAVVTVGSIHGGEASNVIPDTVEAKLTLRYFTPATQDILAVRVPAILRGVIEAFGATADLTYARGFPPVTNHAPEAAIARRAVEALFGPAALIDTFRPRTASEDFAFFLHERPGAFLILGAGDGAPLHSPRYQFNDAILAPAAALWVQLVQDFLTGDAQ
ncbi:M20 aminoacylase family protein [Fuscibacter oryzae]|uniref:Amidohydrolase n=1 Tax=Fuscibacter oryzae TaxID=2803939 RepID=A0A8J7SQC1_9RHOB|nr:M20 aminoacylase family protein [Fuscibacter oryzae]MBL4926646.1 amidohydrolase [Fuscibacter oryzae]